MARPKSRLSFADAAGWTLAGFGTGLLAGALLSGWLGAGSSPGSAAPSGTGGKSGPKRGRPPVP